MKTYRSYVFYLIFILITACSGTFFPVLRKSEQIKKLTIENIALKKENKKLKVQLQAAATPETGEARTTRLANLKKLNDMINEIKRKNKKNTDKVDSLVKHYETEQRAKNS